MLDGKTVLITGGTGSFGKNCTRIILERYKPRKLIVFSRDELKQHEMRQEYPEGRHSPMRYFIGDVREPERLHRAFSGVDVIIHAAAMKQVPASEYNPFEAVKTNILGAQNVINAAIDNHVRRVIALSTDKAANPINLYGATKLCSDKLFIAGNSYSMREKTIFSVVRYGNVMGSRGSVIPFFLEKKKEGKLPVTDSRMTRFWISIDNAVDFVLDCLSMMSGGELFVPKLPSMNIMDLANTICPECEIEIVGIRPGEKVHEVMIPSDEARMAREYESHYVINSYYNSRCCSGNECGKPVPEGFEYSSGDNDWVLSRDEMRRIVNEIRAAMEK